MAMIPAGMTSASAFRVASGAPAKLGRSGLSDLVAKTATAWSAPLNLVCFGPPPRANANSRVLCVENHIAAPSRSPCVKNLSTRVHPLPMRSNHCQASVESSDLRC